MRRRAPAPASQRPTATAVLPVATPSSAPKPRAFRSSPRRRPASTRSANLPACIGLRCLNGGAGGEPMTVSAYVLIQTEVGKAAQVADEVSKIDGVVSAEDVTGPYDVIVRAEAGSVDDLGKMVVSRVQLIDGITRTLTCPVVHL